MVDFKMLNIYTVFNIFKKNAHMLIYLIMFYLLVIH